MVDQRRDRFRPPRVLLVETMISFPAALGKREYHFYRHEWQRKRGRTSTRSTLRQRRRILTVVFEKGVRFFFFFLVVVLRGIDMY